MSNVLSNKMRRLAINLIASLRTFLRFANLQIAKSRCEKIFAATANFFALQKSYFSAAKIIFAAAYMRKFA